MEVRPVLESTFSPDARVRGDAERTLREAEEKDFVSITPPCALLRSGD
jgi:hypothetical protein